MFLSKPRRCIAPSLFVCVSTPSLPFLARLRLYYCPGWSHNHCFVRFLTIIVLFTHLTLRPETKAVKMKSHSILSLLSLTALAAARPVPNKAQPLRREVPQEHSHAQFITTVQSSLTQNNPDNIADPIFGLLGNAVGLRSPGGPPFTPTNLSMTNHRYLSTGSSRRPRPNRRYRLSSASHGGPGLY